MVNVSQESAYTDFEIKMQSFSQSFFAKFVIPMPSFIKVLLYTNAFFPHRLGLMFSLLFLQWPLLFKSKVTLDTSSIDDSIHFYNSLLRIKTR